MKIKNGILVTGSSGFIGRSVVNLLLKNNYNVLAPSSKDLEITNKDSFRLFTSENIDVVIHLAGKTFVPDSWIHPEGFIKTNVLGTQNVAEFCKQKNAKLIYISAYVYGNTIENPIKETHSANVNNPYALSKRMGEEICLFYQSIHGLNVSIVRPFNVYGPGQSKNFLIPEVIEKLKTEKEIKVKDLNPKRDFIHVDDVAGIILKIIENEKQGIYNAGSGKSISVGELISLIQKLNGSQLSVVSENLIRSNEISDTIADISKAISELGWKPTIALEEGIRQMLIAIE